MAIQTELIRTVYEATRGTRPVQTSSDRESLEIDVPGVQLRAWLTPDMRLDLEIRVTAWGKAEERALYDALDCSKSMVAGLLLWEWSEVRRTCAASVRRSA